MRAKRPSHARVPTDLCCIDASMCDVQLPPDPPYCPFSLNTARMEQPGDHWPGGFFVEVVIRESPTALFWRRGTTVEVRFDVVGTLEIRDNACDENVEIDLSLIHI